jgi:N-methylhydantoinase A
LLACLLAEDLGISRIVVPNHAGNFSAWGLLGADIVRTAAASIGKPLSDPAMETTAGVVQGLFEEVRGGSDTPETQGTVLSEVILDLRYAGQAQSVPVALKLQGEVIADSVAAIAARFAAQHHRLYGVVLEETIEIAAARATRRTSLPAREVAYRDAQTSADVRVYLPAYSFHLERETDFRLLNRAELSVGAVIRGPAIIQELTTTTYVDANYTIEVHPSGHLFLSRSET